MYLEGTLSNKNFHPQKVKAKDKLFLSFFLFFLIFFFNAPHLFFLPTNKKLNLERQERKKEEAKWVGFIGLAYYQEGKKDIVVFRFFIEYSSLREFL
jgi:hypothetical protein